MKKKLLTAAIAAAFVAPMAAQADSGPTVYGVAHASVESWDVDGGADNWQVRSRQSRLGIKGSEDLGNGLKAIYKMEFQIDIADNSSNSNTCGAAGTATVTSNHTAIAGHTHTCSGGNNITSRNQYVGLAGGWGTFLLGRHDAPTKMMTISRDKFNTTLGDWNEVRASSNAAQLSDRRTNNAIMYISPSFNGLTVAAQVAPGETNDDEDGFDGYQGIAAKYVNGPIYIGAGWEEVANLGDDATTEADQENWRIAGSYQIGDFNVGALYEDQEDIGNVKGIDGDIWLVNASYTFGNNVVKAQYQESEKDRAAGATDIEEETWSIGIDHNFSKRTKIYAVYTETEGDDNAAVGTDVDSDAFGVGLVHKF